ncbi:MAG: 4Fe-4S binding protein [Chloroflexi bacterium]|nr:4Fe-4S binding protein [Chloroflexota bacterium]
MLDKIKTYRLPLILFLFFEIVAFSLWQISGSIFYLYNFSYIGFFIALGLVLYIRQYPHARMVVQFAVGSYMLIYLGIFSRENMQIEGFWFYLFSGVFQAAVIHYAVAKIFGPLLFGRGWCGYACWTAMILDLLPYKIPEEPRKSQLGFIRYIVFTLSLLFASALFIFKVANMENIMLWSFIIGNILYYMVGIALAVAFKDNRAFCKYICPITIFLKPASYFSLIRVKVHEDKCIVCGKCRRVCPMDVDMLDNSRKRLNGTECILCNACVKSCPTGALEI